MKIIETREHNIIIEEERNLKTWIADIVHSVHIFNVRVHKDFHSTTKYNRFTNCDIRLRYIECLKF